MKNQNDSVNNTYDVAIVGAGSAGCTAAIYATRYNLKTVMISGPMPGGLITEALEVENYPGFEAISGMDLAGRFINQAVALGANHAQGTVESIQSLSKGGFVISTDTQTYDAKSVILAMGTKHKKLNIKGELEFAGRGVSYCATCDGPFFKNKIVAVIGGGNSAVEGAQEIAIHASKVYLIYRSTLKAAPIYVEHLRQKSNIIEIADTNVLEIIGDNKVSQIVLDKNFDGSSNITLDGVFIQIGYEPINNIAKSLGVEITQNGYVKVDAGMGTNIKGVYCAGDLNNWSNMLHQQITSAGEGAIAAQSVYRYLQGLDHIIHEL